MKVAITILAFVVTAELVLGAHPSFGSHHGYGPPQPQPSPHMHRPQNGPPIPANFPPHHGHINNKNDFFSKYNPHFLPPGVRGPPPQQASFPKFFPPPGKAQQKPHHTPNIRPQPGSQHGPHHGPQQGPQHGLQGPQLGPQYQSKPHLFLNDNQPHGQSSRPTPKITNIWTGPKLSGPPDFPRIPTTSASTPSAIIAPHSPPTTTLPEKFRPQYIINSDDERGPIKTIPAPNLNPSDRPANFDEQLYKVPFPQQYAQPLDNSIIDDKLLSYQVTEDPSMYKPFSNQPSYFAPDPDTVPTSKIPPTTDYNSIPSNGKVPLDVALQQHLDNQPQQLPAEQVPSTDSLSPQELYSLLNSNSAAPQTTYMVQQPVMYAIPQTQPLDLQVGQLQYQPQAVQLQYAQQPAASAVQLQYAQPGVTDLQYMQPQAVQYQTQAVQYQPQAMQYQQQLVQYQPQPIQQQYQQQTADGIAYQQQQQQELIQQQQEKQQDNDIQYQQDQYEARNPSKGKLSDQQESAADGQEQEHGKFESIREQYYSAVPNEQTAGVLAQIAESAANNDAAVATDETQRVESVNTVEKPAAAPEQTVKMQTSVQIQQSVPLYEGTYASSRRTNQEYVDEGGDSDEMLEGSETVQVVSKSSSSSSTATLSSSPLSSSSSSINGHAPSQFPYNAAKINAFATN